MPKDDNLPHNRWHIEAHEKALPRLIRLQSRYPAGSLITIGFTSRPHTSDWEYNKMNEFYRRTELTPPLKLQEQILFSSCKKFNALTVEYIMQVQLSEEAWKSRFGTLCNPQKALPSLPYKFCSTLPQEALKDGDKGDTEGESESESNGEEDDGKDESEKAYYVYAKFSRVAKT
jgi:hypothetical protein